MKKSMSAAEIITRHIESDRIMESAPTAEYRKSNREAKKLNELFRIVEKDLTLAKEVYKELLISDCVVTRGHAAAECLSLEIFIDKAVEVLTELSVRTDIGMQSFHSETCLKWWNKNGYHEMYPGQHTEKKS